VPYFAIDYTLPFWDDFFDGPQGGFTGTTRASGIALNAAEDLSLLWTLQCWPDDFGVPERLPEPPVTVVPIANPTGSGSGSGGGCGPDLLPQFSGDFGLWDFGPACRAHDSCYNNCGGKLECDRQFGVAVFAECDGVYARAQWALETGFLVAGAAAAACYAAADLFTAAVLVFGELRYPSKCTDGVI
jgi:hypothetical protein